MGEFGECGYFGSLDNGENLDNVEIFIVWIF